MLFSFDFGRPNLEPYPIAFLRFVKIIHGLV